MLNAIFRPLEKWPGTPTPPAARKSSPFKSAYLKTLDLLEAELQHLAAHNVVIQAQVERSQLRNDGWLKSDAAVKGPAVMVSFHSGIDGNEYVYPCDTFADWHDNIRAIALALEALRKIDRYGVTRRGEQYQGFRALPPGPEAAQPPMSPQEAAEVVNRMFPAVSPDALLTVPKLFQVALTEAQKRAHPDRGGSHEEFVKLQQAADTLAAHHNRAERAHG